MLGRRRVPADTACDISVAATSYPRRERTSENVVLTFTKQLFQIVNPTRRSFRRPFRLLGLIVRPLPLVLPPILLPLVLLIFILPNCPRINESTGKLDLLFHILFLLLLNPLLPQHAPLIHYKNAQDTGQARPHPLQIAEPLRGDLILLQLHDLLLGLRILCRLPAAQLAIAHVVIPLDPQRAQRYRARRYVAEGLGRRRVRLSHRRERHVARREAQHRTGQTAGG
ncbi:unnamed protein product [Chondrus crispus]|uniref:Uncharacterized protein n=1 Tax=Chondrus crispus TaxID=2769 RepID=R7QKA0_CHOCR|nr:unnamed protein product [Chondrus crispus]CDF37906.1 unnamed protein product [Chondrus crispus]|eukprot:XP_005717777.1 unnamed protein product [Chondrus crispus]